MARKHDFNGSRKPLTAGATQTIVFSGSDLPGSVPGASIVEFHLAIINGSSTETQNATIANISRVRLKSNGIPVQDWALPQMRSLQASHQRSAFDGYYGLTYAASTGYASLVTQTSLTSPQYGLTIPCNMIGDFDEDSADRCAFPMLSSPTLEVTITVPAGGAQALVLGWTTSDVMPEFYSVFYGNPMNIAAGLTNAKYPFVEDGAVRSIVIPGLGLARLRAVLGGVQRLNLLHKGDGLEAAGRVTGSLLQQAQRYRSALTEGIDGGGANLYGADYRVCHKFVGMTPAPAGSFLELDTIAGATNPWPGAGAEVAIWAIRPQAR